MGKAEREKGARYERTIAAVLTAAGFDCTRGARNGVGAAEDLTHAIPGVWIETKNQRTLALPKWLRQARADCGPRTPIVVFHIDREGDYACLPLSTLLALLPTTEQGGTTK